MSLHKPRNTLKPACELACSRRSQRPRESSRLTLRFMTVTLAQARTYARVTVWGAVKPISRDQLTRRLISSLAASLL